LVQTFAGGNTGADVATFQSPSRDSFGSDSGRLVGLRAPQAKDFVRKSVFLLHQYHRFIPVILFAPHRPQTGERLNDEADFIQVFTLVSTFLLLYSPCERYRGQALVLHRSQAAGQKKRTLHVTVQGVYSLKSKHTLSFFKHYSHKSVLRYQYGSAKFRDPRNEFRTDALFSRRMGPNPGGSAGICFVSDRASTSVRDRGG
jgi:hypothetical protein